MHALHYHAYTSKLCDAICSTILQSMFVSLPVALATSCDPAGTEPAFKSAASLS